MPRPRFDRLDPEVRARILDVAEAAFSEHGFHDASYNAIIQATGVSKGSFYYYFDDKADLYATALSRALERAGRDLGGGLWDGEDDGRDFWVQVEALCEALGAAAAAHPDAVRLAKAGLGVVQHPAMARIFEAGQQRVARILTLGQARGAVRDDLPLELLVGITMAVGEAFDRYVLERATEAGELVGPGGPGGPMGPEDARVVAGLFRRVVGG